MKSPAGQAGIAGELREVMHRNPPLTKTRMAVAPIHSLASTLGRAFAVFEKEVFLENCFILKSKDIPGTLKELPESQVIE